MTSSESVEVISVEANAPNVSRSDLVAVEEPLEIRISFESAGERRAHSLSITMRTPGHDAELAVGFLVSERIIRSPDQIARIQQSEIPGSNAVRIDLAPGVAFDPQLLERHFYTTSSCGVCGKSALAAIASTGLEPLPRDIISVASSTIHGLPESLRSAQSVFQHTGGLHAAALFDRLGQRTALREDVGRHNAVDKVVGATFLEGLLPLNKSLLMVSGRASFELVQKALAAGIPILAAVGAPSSLAIQLAREFDLTLLGFVRNNRFNIYSGEWRITITPQPSSRSADPEQPT
jgi:FdhD protein